VRHELAESIVERFRTFRTTAGAAVSMLDTTSAHEELRALVAVLEQKHRELEAAAQGWTEESRAQKNSLRKERDQSFLGVRIALARLGERERIDRLEKLPYQQRLDDLEKYLERMALARRVT
jgi:hypothetical protein